MCGGPCNAARVGLSSRVTFNCSSDRHELGRTLHHNTPLVRSRNTCAKVNDAWTSSLPTSCRSLKGVAVPPGATDGQFGMHRNELRPLVAQPLQTTVRAPQDSASWQLFKIFEVVRVVHHPPQSGTLVVDANVHRRSYLVRTASDQTSDLLGLMVKLLPNLVSLIDRDECEVVSDSTWVSNSAQDQARHRTSGPTDTQA